MEATRVNNISVVELLVRVPGTLSQRELDVSLLAAAKAKSTECARILLDAGADANTKVPSVFVLLASIIDLLMHYAVNMFLLKVINNT